MGMGMGMGMNDTDAERIHSFESDQADSVLSIPDKVVKRIVNLQMWKGWELVVGIGDIIVEAFFAGSIEQYRRRGRVSSKAVRRLLANDHLPMSSASLSRALRTYELADRMGSLVSPVKHLLVSHYYAVLPLRDEEQEKLLREASEQRWSKRALEAEVASRRPSRRGGPRRLPRFQKTLRRLSRVVSDDHALADIEQADALEPEQLAEVRDALEHLERVLSLVQAQLVGNGQFPGPRRASPTAPDSD